MRGHLYKCFSVAVWLGRGETPFPGDPLRRGGRRLPGVRRRARRCPPRDQAAVSIAQGVDLYMLRVTRLYIYMCVYIYIYIYVYI